MLFAALYVFHHNVVTMCFCFSRTLVRFDVVQNYRPWVAAHATAREFVKSGSICYYPSIRYTNYKLEMQTANSLIGGSKSCHT